MWPRSAGSPSRHRSCRCSGSRRQGTCRVGRLRSPMCIDDHPRGSEPRPRDSESPAAAQPRRPHTRHHIAGWAPLRRTRRLPAGDAEGSHAQGDDRATRHPAHHSRSEVSGRPPSRPRLPGPTRRRLGRHGDGRRQCDRPGTHGGEVGEVLGGGLVPDVLREDHSRRKCRSCTSMSVLTTRRSDPRRSTAASSPDGRSTAGAVFSRLCRAAISLNSPRSATVCPLIAPPPSRVFVPVVKKIVSQHQARGGTVVQAYILIQTEVGSASRVAGRSVRSLASPRPTTSPAPTTSSSGARRSRSTSAGQMVVAKVQAVPGITRTLTCPVVHLS